MASAKTPPAIGGVEKCVGHEARADTVPTAAINFTSPAPPPPITWPGSISAEADQHPERGVRRRQRAAAERDAEAGAADRARQPVRDPPRAHVDDDGGGEPEDEHDLRSHYAEIPPKAAWMVCQKTV